jgi:DNA mismatch endonuclease (patch repair protein)
MYSIQRSAVMRAVKSKNATPEMKVRRLLHQAGYRFRLHPADLLGKPCLVFPSKRAVIFAHGRFWHQHPVCWHADRPPQIVFLVACSRRQDARFSELG